MNSELPERNKSVVVQSRVSPKTKAKMLVTAGVRGISESDLIRAWLDEQASLVGPETWQQDIEEQFNQDSKELSEWKLAKQALIAGFTEQQQILPQQVQE